MQLVSIRDLRNKLPHYLEVAKKGDAVIITDRGAPVAILHNLDQIEENAGQEEKLAYYARQGVLTLPKKNRPFTPVEIAEARGEPASETLIKERK